LYFAIVWFGCVSASTLADEGIGTGIQASQQHESLAQRIHQLEAETAALRTELGLLQDVTPLTPVANFDPDADGDGGLVYYDDVMREMSDCAWWKGDYKIVPYGSLWGNAAYDTRRTSPGAYTFYVPSPEVEGEDAFHVDTRRTRVGLDITGPQIQFLQCFNSRGKIEIDFHGAFVIENKPGVLLRHAYAELYNDDYRILAGQTWDLVSPLYPHMVSYTVGWGGGNIGYRRMQIRMERFLPVSDVLSLTPAISFNQNIVSDFAGATAAAPESTDWPLIQGRLGATLGPRGAGCDPITCGISGHIGEQGFDFAAPAAIDDARVRTWSFNVDMRIPINEQLGFQGEFFTGANMGTFLGGIIQGVDLTRREAIHSTGGWFELWYHWADGLHSHVGYGIDDPRNSDVTDTVNGRTYNDFVFANLVIDVTEKMKLGFEVSDWRTHWLGRSPGDAVRFEFSGQYNF